MIHDTGKLRNISEDVQWSHGKRFLDIVSDLSRIAGL